MTDCLPNVQNFRRAEGGGITSCITILGQFWNNPPGEGALPPRLCTATLQAGIQYCAVHEAQSSRRRERYVSIPTCKLEEPGRERKRLLEQLREASADAGNAGNSPEFELETPCIIILFVTYTRSRSKPSCDAEETHGVNKNKQVTPIPHQPRYRAKVGGSSRLIA